LLLVSRLRADVHNNCELVIRAKTVGWQECTLTSIVDCGPMHNRLAMVVPSGFKISSCAIALSAARFTTRIRASSYKYDELTVTSGMSGHDTDIVHD